MAIIVISYCTLSIFVHFNYLGLSFILCSWAEQYTNLFSSKKIPFIIFDFAE